MDYGTNLFNPQWTTGNLDAISFVVEWMGRFAMIIISLGGFFMVILPIIRNVFNGVVCVAPNLCSKIHSVHQAKLEFKDSGGNQIAQAFGAVASLIMSIIPDFIALSDFDDGVKDPKSYMLSALPKMCVYVFIGVFVFYGYPSKFADKFSHAATSIIDLALNNVDPKVIVDSIPKNWARPDFSTDDATDLLGQNVNDLSLTVFRTFTSTYGDITNDMRISLSHEIEAYIQGKLSEIMDISDNKDYKMSAEARITHYDPQLNTNATWPNPSYDENEHIYIYQFKTPITGTFNPGTVGGTDGDYLMCIIKFYEQAKTASDASNVQCVATLNSSHFSNNPGKSCVWTTPIGVFNIDTRQPVILNGVTSSSIKEQSSGASKYYVITFSSDKSSIENGTGSCSNLKVLDNTRVGAQHTVTKVKFGSSYLFEPVDSTRWNSWTEGSGPTEKTSSGTVGNNNSTNSGTSKETQTVE